VKQLSSVEGRDRQPLERERRPVEKKKSLGLTRKSSRVHPGCESPKKTGDSSSEDFVQPSSPQSSHRRNRSLSVGFAGKEFRFRQWCPGYGCTSKRRIAIDVETTLIDHERPAQVPTLVLGIAFDGRRGWFLHGTDVLDFLEAHDGNKLFFHNSAFDIAVILETARRARRECDLLERVEQQRVFDTQVMMRLLANATHGHTARNACSLQHGVEGYLGLKLSKQTRDSAGNTVRLSFGQYLHKSFRSISDEHLRYAALDAVATRMLAVRLLEESKAARFLARTAFGYAGDEWLVERERRYGVLTHDIQIRASIVLGVLSRTGVLVDQERRDEKVAALEGVVCESENQLALAGLPCKGSGSQVALRRRIERLARKEGSQLSLIRTPTGQVATNEEQLLDLANLDPIFRELLNYRQAKKLLTTYLQKMVPGKRLHGRFEYLMNSGRTSCGGGINFQNLPKELDAAGSHQATIRSCFVAPPGSVFVVIDYSQIELAVLGWAWANQLEFGDSLHRIVSAGQDMHRLIAAEVLGKKPEQVTGQERSAAKPVSLGRPGGLGWETIQKQARTSYGVELSQKQVLDLMEAYEKLCPELSEHLKARVDTGLEIARALDLTEASYRAETGKSHWGVSSESSLPVGWLGRMLLKVLKSESPQTKGSIEYSTVPRPYSDLELDYFWRAATRLPLTELSQQDQSDIYDRRPSPRLSKVVGDLYGRESVITATGRLRANARYAACRNGIMQGLAADGAIYALWKIMRAGFKIVNFIHDEVIVEVPCGPNLPETIAQIEQLMVDGMHQVVPGANIRIETSVRRSFSKFDEVPLEELATRGE
jgi:DNA polymerase I-like protein with 3'-5' exonuclease and polymerase domains